MNFKIPISDFPDAVKIHENVFTHPSFTRFDPYHQTNINHVVVKDGYIMGPLLNELEPVKRFTDVLLSL